MLPLDSLLNFIAPNRCLSCKAEGSTCCQNCLDVSKDLQASYTCYFCNKKSQTKLGICKTCRPKQSLDGLVWFADYKNFTARNLVKSLKFNQVYSASKPMADAISGQLDLVPVSLNKDLIITAIPTANKRIRQRGWDQAKLIAKAVSRSQHTPYKSLLVRMSSFDQIGATKRQRAQASQNFFKPIRKAHIQNKTIILIDDVVTTGSTLNSAAKVLKRAGAKEVYGLTFARQGL